MFLEVYVTQYLTERKISSGVSKSKLENYNEEVSISYKLNIELPIFLNIDDKGREIIGRADKLRKKRNTIVHSGHKEVIITKDDAVEAYNLIIDIHKLIDSEWKQSGLNLNII